jgi:hypothetical protein
MALHWSVEKVKDWKKLQADETVSWQCDALIQATMTLDMGSIKPKNIDEWLVRLHMLAQCGCYIGVKGDGEGNFENWVPTREELERWVGLYTNAETKTRAGFKKALIKNLEYDAEAAVRREKEKAA